MIPKDTPAGKDNCGIATTAMLAGVSYREAEALFLRLCDKTDFTTVWDRADVMQALGLTVMEEKHYGLKPTLRMWLHTEWNPTSDYQVALTGHVVALRGSMLYDQLFRWGQPALTSVYTRKRVHAHIRLGDKHDYRTKR